ncbi:MAG: DUF4292 domain-containing protein [Deltaproteobacteria bacterium]|nr:DUF4292 domain-containing protein [Deltaproteobacteria bacterium]
MPPVRWLGVLLSLGALALGGCPNGGRDAPADALTTPEDVLARAEAFLAGGPAHAILEARASQYNDHGGIKGKVEILVARPGRVRFSGLSPTDDLVSVLATDGERFTAFERGQKQCHVGRACPANVGRFTGFSLETDQLVGVLIGRPPIVPHERVELTWDRQMGAYRLDLIGTAVALGGTRGQVQRLWVAHEDGRVVRLQVRSADRVEVDVRYADWKKVGGHLLPMGIDVRMARDSTDLRILYRDVDVTAPVDGGAFDFACPAGTTLVDEPCF